MILICIILNILVNVVFYNNAFQIYGVSSNSILKPQLSVNCKVRSNHQLIKCEYDSRTFLKKDNDGRNWLGNFRSKFPSRDKFADDLARAGKAGILAYGILNFAWYTIATTVMWSLTKNKLGFAQFIQLLAITWAGSQVTKPFRMAGSLFLAPFVGKAMLLVQQKYQISENKCFSILSLLTLSSCAIFFGALILFSNIPLINPASPKLAFFIPLNTIFKPYLQIVKSPRSLSAQGQIQSSNDFQSVEKNTTTYRLNRYNEPIDPKNQRHGWDSHPKICRGFWKIEKLIPSEVSVNITSVPLVLNNQKSTSNNDTQFLPSISTSTTTNTIITENSDNHSNENNTINNNNNYDINNELKQKWIAKKDYFLTKLQDIDHVILKEDGNMKIATPGVKSLGWEFTPANRRIVYEAMLPEDGIILRFSSEFTQVPRVVTRALGVIRIREIEENDNKSDFKKIPSSNSRWPVVAKFGMNKALYGKYGKDKHLAVNVKKGLLIESE